MTANRDTAEDLKMVKMAEKAAAAYKAYQEVAGARKRRHYGRLSSVASRLPVPGPMRCSERGGERGLGREQRGLGIDVRP